jgi:hypothetical protein
LHPLLLIDPSEPLNPTTGVIPATLNKGIGPFPSRARPAEE